MDSFLQKEPRAAFACGGSRGFVLLPAFLHSCGRLSSGGNSVSWRLRLFYDTDWVWTEKGRTSDKGNGNALSDSVFMGRFLGGSFFRLENNSENLLFICLLHIFCLICSDIPQRISESEAETYLSHYDFLWGKGTVCIWILRHGKPSYRACERKTGFCCLSGISGIRTAGGNEREFKTHKRKPGGDGKYAA